MVKSSTNSTIECLIKISPCLTKGSKNDWKAFQNYGTSCERLIGRMKNVLTEKMLTHSNDIDHKMKGYITMPTMFT